MRNNTQLLTGNPNRPTRLWVSRLCDLLSPRGLSPVLKEGQQVCRSGWGQPPLPGVTWTLALLSLLFLALASFLPTYCKSGTECKGV